MSPRRLVPSLTLLACVAVVPAAEAPSPASEQPVARLAPADPAASSPLIEIAILLDTSSSMDGLIDQARTRLWSIVNDLAATTRDGAIPDLRVAVYEYGNSGLSAESHHIRQVLPLSDDLDAVSEALFALTTNGGDEYCGAVIGRAVEDLAWSEGDHFRAIFIAGNEPFTQGPVPYQDTCKAAVSKGVVVNTIHCGDESAARSGAWIDGARLADGTSISIDQNQAAVAIAAPQDARIGELNEALNDTYVAYGAEGPNRAERQVAQDANAAASAPSTLAARAGAKSSGLYNNARWDLVDAVAEEQVALEEVDRTHLPEDLQAMSDEELAAHVAAQAARRSEIQAELAELVAEREAYVTQKRAEQGDAAADDFGTAARKALAAQLRERGFQPAE